MNHDHHTQTGHEHSKELHRHEQHDGAYVRAGRPGMDHGGGHHGHHAHMVADFRKRFWVSLVLSVPVVALAPMIQEWLGLRETTRFPGDTLIQFVFASAVFFYGGWPFLWGLFDELRRRSPGMMTLIALATAVAYGYSTAVVFGLPGMGFFWELATLVDIMLLGHWIEMRSVLGASRALEELVRLMPAEAHRLKADGSTVNVPLSELRPGDRVLIRPGEKVPVDGIIVEGQTTLNEAMLTGESRPVEKGEGERVIGGAVNGEAASALKSRRRGKRPT